jgi:hypothetical protein
VSIVSNSELLRHRRILIRPLQRGKRPPQCAWSDGDVYVWWWGVSGQTSKLTRPGPHRLGRTDTCCARRLVRHRRPAGRESRSGLLSEVSLMGDCRICLGHQAI